MEHFFTIHSPLQKKLRLFGSGDDPTLAKRKSRKGMCDYLYVRSSRILDFLNTSLHHSPSRQCSGGDMKGNFTLHKPISNLQPPYEGDFYPPQAHFQPETAVWRGFLPSNIHLLQRNLHGHRMHRIDFNDCLPVVVLNIRYSSLRFLILWVVYNIHILRLPITA